MAEDHRQAWPELLDLGRRQTANGLDRDDGIHALALALEPKLETLRSAQIDADKRLSGLQYQIENLGRQMTEMRDQHKALESGIKQFVYITIAAGLSLGANLLLSKH